jgi:hypothetical protein
MATTNLPAIRKEDSAAGTKLFFDSYGQEPLEFNANDVSACISFFEKKGFDNDAALIVATVILKQAKLDGTPIFKILDTLSGVDALALSSIVGEILNNNRTPTSTLGFRTNPVIPNQIRNISP